MGGYLKGTVASNILCPHHNAEFRSHNGTMSLLLSASFFWWLENQKSCLGNVGSAMTTTTIESLSTERESLHLSFKRNVTHERNTNRPMGGSRGITVWIWSYVWLLKLANDDNDTYSTRPPYSGAPAVHIPVEQEHNCLIFDFVSEAHKKSPIMSLLRFRSHRMRKQICRQICVQTLWCCLQCVWTLPLTIMCSKICMYTPVARCSASCVNGALVWL